MSRKDVDKNKQLPPKDQEEICSLITPYKPIDLLNISELPEPEKEPIYHPMLHGPGLDSLAQISVKETPKRDIIENTAVYTGHNYTFTLKGYRYLIETNLVGLKISTQKLLDALIINITQKNSKDSRIRTTASISLEEYMQSCGIEVNEYNKKKQRKKVKEDLEILYWLSLDWKEYKGIQTEGTDKAGNKNFLKMRICSAIGIIKNGQIVVNFTPEIVNYLTQSYIMCYPDNLLKTDDRNPCTYHIGRKLSLHYNNPNNQHRGTYNIISVRALLDSTKDIPSEAEVTGRHYFQYRILPLFKALDALVEIKVLKKWELCDAKKKPLNKRQQERKNYKSTLERYIYFEFIENKKLSQYIAQAKQTTTKAKKRQSKKQKEETKKCPK